MNSTNSQLTNNQINLELERVNEWLDLNKLSLNVSKTKFMIFHPQNKRVLIPNLEIKGEKIEYVSEFDFLGIVLDTQLKWKAHLNKISKKISKAIGILAKLKNYVPLSTMKTIYFSLVNSYLDYGILCWGHNSGNLNILQKKALRIITKSKYNAHTEPLFKRLKILKLCDIYNFKLYKFYYKLINRTLPAYFMNSNYLIIQQTTHTHFTRGRTFIKPRISHSFAEGCLRHRLPCLLNDTSTNILEKVNTHSEYGFASYVKHTSIEKYSFNCSTVNCYICNS